MLTVFAALLVPMAGATTALADHRENHERKGGGEDPVIDVVWHEDGMGFNVTSSQDISNVIVELCPRDDQRQAHKHEAVFQQEDIREWEHREDETITDIWVKSGDNHDPTQEQPPEPYNNPGAGEHFENEDAVCEPRPCEGPEEINARTQGTSIVVNWTTVEEADSYTLYRAEGDSSFEEIEVTEDTEYRDDNVTVDETYTYRVTATIDERETGYCDQAQAVAIPDLGTVFAGSMAVLSGMAAYVTYRRRN